MNILNKANKSIFFLDYIMVEFIYDSNLEKLDEMGIPRNKVQKNLNKYQSI